MIKECKLNQNHQILGNVEWPQALATTYHGEIMCADPRQHRIVVFNRDLVFKYQIGSGQAGSGKDEFNEPVDLILNQLGKSKKNKKISY